MSDTRAGDSSSVEIVGADANNLQNVDVTFPLKGISVVTGVSGSGKSSLLADTLAAEGSRRMRIFLGTSQEDLERDDVRAFVGPLPPTILVGQRGFRPNIRTTVGTATGLLSVLRRLFISVAVPYSDRAGGDVPEPSAESYAAWIAKHYRGAVEVWVAPVRQQRTDGVAAVKRLAASGVQKVILRSETDPKRLAESGREVATSKFQGVNPNVRHTIEALIGAVDVRGASDRKSLLEILVRAFAAGHGDDVVISLPVASDPDLAGPFGPRLDSEKHWVHPEDPAVFARANAHLLSFNAPEHADSGACRECAGTGIVRRLRESELIAHPGRSMRDGAFTLWTDKNYKYLHVQHETIEGLRGLHGFAPEVPWSKLPGSARAMVLNGTGDEPVFDRDRSGKKFGVARPFPGFRKLILEKASAGTKIAAQLAAYVESGPCEVCGGTRWSLQARALRVAGRGIADLLASTFVELEGLTKAQGDFSRAVPIEARAFVEALHRHAHAIVSVGVGYLTGDRGMLEVSEGESRRIRLARVLDARETGLCLLLDEPARGLHEADLSRLAVALADLRGDHTVILNEHRERLWSAADWLVEVGPGGGAAGGEITYAGPPRGLLSLGDDEPVRAALPVPSKHPRITIRGASIHNVGNVDCEIPVGRLTCITGVSGSGKSSFVRGVLAPALLQTIGSSTSDFSLRNGQWRSIKGTNSIREVVALDQAMPQPNRRSLVATFTGVFDDIRKVFCSSPEAKRDGLSASDFGVNSGSGRCGICFGIGDVQDGELWSVCPSCGGARYGHRVLSVRVAGVNVQELLDTPAEQLRPHADKFHISRALIEAMCDLGIGYVALGRRMDTLSGGEVQRLRLAMRLGTNSADSMIFIMDEPAVGLHARDVRRLGTALERVLDGGRNTIVLVEHDLRLIRSADWVVDFGPGSGPEGGQIVFSGPPGQLARTRTPTGMALAGKLPATRPHPPRRGLAPRARALPVVEQVARTAALLRTLISGEASAATSEDGAAEPVVVVSERFWSKRDPCEVVGLDHEIPKLLLDVQRAVAGPELFEPLLDAWQKQPGGWLAVQPFLYDLQVWGAQMPASVLRDVSSHVSKEGLRLVTAKGEAVYGDLDIVDVRATGDRFLPADKSRDAYARAFRDAFAVGARYVELRDRNGRLLATATDRLLDLSSAVVAPMVPVPSHFSRHEPIGRCPMCAGRRVVTALPDSLVIAKRKAAPDSDTFLTREANDVMKGVRQNELKPFLTRMVKEGLWRSNASFERLAPNERELFLFGFWSRPGAGSFLKSSSVDPAEVSAWLRWDGLYRHVLAQADRSPNAGWARAVREGASEVRCPRCEGSGLQRFAKLLRVGDLSFDEWVRLPDSKRKIEELRKIQPLTSRQRKSKQRVLHCLAPLSQRQSVAATIVNRAVESFTTMPAADDVGS